MKTRAHILFGLLAVACIAPVPAQEERKSSYAPVVPNEALAVTMSRMKSEKAAVMKRQAELLQQRYDLRNNPAPNASMARGKPLQSGIRVKLAPGTSWERLAALTPAAIRDGDLFPAGFLPLPHPNHPEGGMVFPQFQINELKRQEGRDLTRFDLDFDLPDHFLPEFPAPIFLTTRPDLGDVSRGKNVTSDNYFELFDGILNPKQLEGLRLLVSPFPQQQFNQTSDRRSERPHRGVACFDCHANGHANGATHLAGDVRPQEHRHRIDTPSLRGVNVLERGSQVHFMAEFQALLDFPPAPKLGVTGRLNEKASDAERRGQELFFGKGQCVMCHAPPYFTDNSMHNLQTERFFKTKTINGRTASADGPIKTFPLRGIKDSPPYLHDGRLLTLEDTVEFFNLMLGTQLTAAEKEDLVAYLRVL
jgi:cytochrome c peroxidase